MVSLLETYFYLNFIFLKIIKIIFALHAIFYISEQLYFDFEFFCNQKGQAQLGRIVSFSRQHFIENS